VNQKLRRVRDFQIFISPDFERELRRRMAETVFPLEEAVREWMAEHRLEAEFSKILVCIESSTHPMSEHWIGSAKIMGEAPTIGEILLVRDPEELERHIGDYEWVADQVLEALATLASEVGFRSRELEEEVRRIGRLDPPCLYRFEKLTKRDRKTKTVCETWFEAVAGRTTIRVRFLRDDEVVDEVVIAERAGQLYLDLDFPLRSAIVRDGAYKIRDKDRKDLAVVPIPE